MKFRRVAQVIKAIHYGIGLYILGLLNKATDFNGSPNFYFFHIRTERI